MTVAIISKQAYVHPPTGQLTNTSSSLVAFLTMP